MPTSTRLVEGSLIRNTLRHVYDEAEVIPIVRLIYSDYAPLLKQLDNTLDDLSKNQDYQQQ